MSTEVPVSVLIAEARRLESEYASTSTDYPVSRMILSARAALAWCAVRRARDAESPVRISLKEVR